MERNMRTLFLTLKKKHNKQTSHRPDKNNKQISYSPTILKVHLYVYTK